MSKLAIVGDVTCHLRHCVQKVPGRDHGLKVHRERQVRIKAWSDLRLSCRAFFGRILHKVVYKMTRRSPGQRKRSEHSLNRDSPSAGYFMAFFFFFSASIRAASSSCSRLTRSSSALIAAASAFCAAVTRFLPSRSQYTCQRSRVFAACASSTHLVHFPPFVSSKADLLPQLRPLLAPWSTSSVAFRFGSYVPLPRSSQPILVFPWESRISLQAVM
jgi:hypothetical protein